MSDIDEELNIIYERLAILEEISDKMTDSVYSIAETVNEIIQAQNILFHNGIEPLSIIYNEDPDE